jgi:K+-transporting ATPase ATPase A chain
MPYQSWLEPVIYVLLLIGLTPLAGFYIARVLDGGRFRGDFLLRPMETVIYRLSGIDPVRPMAWREDLLCLLLFNGLGLAAVFALQLAQGVLPLNTAVSFATNTNRQAYSGEVTLSYLTQLLGLTVQNFLSAATGLAVMAALARGLARFSGGRSRLRKG